MPVCVQPGLIPINNGANQVEVMMPAPSPCPGGFMVFSAAEVDDLQAKAANNILTLSYADATVLSGAVIGVWLVAWSFRRYIQVLNGPGE